MSELCTRKGAVATIKVLRGELNETVAEQRIKISKLELQGVSYLPDPPTTAALIESVGTRKVYNPEDKSTASFLAEFIEFKEHLELEVREANEQVEKGQAEKTVKEEVHKVTRRRAKREATKKAVQEVEERVEEAARAKAERTAKHRIANELKEQAGQEANEKAERQKERLEEEKWIEWIKRKGRETAEREAWDGAGREAKERGKTKTKKSPELRFVWGEMVSS